MFFCDVSQWDTQWKCISIIYFYQMFNGNMIPLYIITQWNHIFIEHKTQKCTSHMLRRQRNKVVGEKKGKESEVGDVSVKQMEKEKENKMVSGGRRN